MDYTHLKFRNGTCLVCPKARTSAIITTDVDPLSEGVVVRISTPLKNQEPLDVGQWVLFRTHAGRIVSDADDLEIMVIPVNQILSILEPQ